MVVDRLIRSPVYQSKGQRKKRRLLLFVSVCSGAFRLSALPKSISLRAILKRLAHGHVYTLWAVSHCEHINGPAVGTKPVWWIHFLYQKYSFGNRRLHRTAAQGGLQGEIVRGGKSLRRAEASVQRAVGTLSICDSREMERVLGFQQASSCSLSPEDSV